MSPKETFMGFTTIQENKILARAFGIKERKLRVTSEIIFYSFGKKISYIVLQSVDVYFQLFRIIVTFILILSLKNV